jgi:hypothetical protein
MCRSSTAAFLKIVFSVTENHLTVTENHLEIKKQKNVVLGNQKPVSADFFYHLCEVLGFSTLLSFFVKEKNAELSIN